MLSNQTSTLTSTLNLMTNFTVSNYFSSYKFFGSHINQICDDNNNDYQYPKEPEHIYQPNLITHNIIKYTYPIILFVGIIGNILSFIIMLKIYRRKRVSYKFAINLIALSLADLSVLIFGCFREYSDDVFDLKLKTMNNFSCKLLYFSCYLFSCFSAYLHAFISFER